MIIKRRQKQFELTYTYLKGHNVISNLLRKTFIILSILLSLLALYSYYGFSTGFEDVPQSCSKAGYFGKVEYRGDLNYDGNMEVIVQIGKGGPNWNSSGYMIFSFDKEDEKIKDLTPHPFPKHPRSSPFWTIFSTKDLSEEGVPELIVLDPRLEDLSWSGQASSPRSWLIYEWSYLHDKYVNRSYFYPSFYDKLIQKELDHIVDTGPEGHRFTYLRSWYSIYLHLLHKGASDPWISFTTLWIKYSQDPPITLTTIKSVVEERI